MELTSEDLNKEIIEVKIELLLQNLKGYNYIEIMEIVFCREDPESNDIYNLSKFNIRLEKEII